MIPLRKKLTKALPFAVGVTFAVVALAAEAGADLTLGAHAEHGDIVVDASGNTLYLFVPDAQGDSTCYDACAENWPPLTSDGDVTVAEGLTQDLVGSVTRTDGTEQVTYGGWPLYTFANDTEPGQANGQGLNEAWYVIAADGTPVGMPETDNGDGGDGENGAPDGQDGGDAPDGEDGAPSDEGDGASGGQNEGDAPDGEDGDDAGTGAQGEDMDTLMREGSAVFSRICAACHGANGDQALAEHVAILADNSRLENERLVLRRVIHGGGYMPGFGHVLSDREVAAVATFVRNSWDNEYGLVGEEAAAEMR